MLKDAKRNWKTTAMGMAGLLTTIAYVIDAVANGKPIDFQFVLASLTAAAVSLGLIAAKDGDKTGTAKALLAFLVIGALALPVSATAAPNLSSRSGRLTLALAGDATAPDLSVHPVIGVSPLAGYNFEAKEAVFNPALVSALELDIRGFGGPTAGASFSVGQTGIPNITLAGGLSFHPPQLGDLTGGAVTHVIVQYQQSVVGSPFIRQIVFGPALAF